MKIKPYKVLMTKEGICVLKDEAGYWWSMRVPSRRIHMIDGHMLWIRGTDYYNHGHPPTGLRDPDKIVDWNGTPEYGWSKVEVQNLVWQYRWMFIDPLAMKWREPGSNEIDQRRYPYIMLQTKELRDALSQDKETT